MRADKSAAWGPMTNPPELAGPRPGDRFTETQLMERLIACEQMRTQMMVRLSQIERSVENLSVELTATKASNNMLMQKLFARSMGR